MPTNRLVREKSPYLLQHAYNPVDWFPWGEEAFKKARTEDKPIFLSIGYSTCHWCHVMEKESFEDRVIAQLLNDAFVCIKVDREERPDIDNIYMSLCQLMTGSGGWPLTIIMTPGKKPFFAATYIPKENRFGRIGLMNLLPKIDLLWKTQRDGVLKTSNQIVDTLEQMSKDSSVETFDESILDTTYRMLEKNFDEKFGGFGHAPKFPSPHNLFFLLRVWKRTKNRKALDMVAKTLQNMRQGGIFDHIGFGFHRYSTDEEWLVPHFEKMLYDQALLAMAYVETYQATGNKIYEKPAREIFSYVLRDMVSKEGGFYSAVDADSEGEEGKFYLWTQDEIKKILGQDAHLFLKVFNVKKDGNFVEESTGHKNGKNILYRDTAYSVIAKKWGIFEQRLIETIERALHKLFQTREKRIRPHKDDKILTNWNGLMIAALAKAGQVFDELKYTEAAQKATHFILKNMRKSDGRLLHRYRNGEAAITANLEDYAFFIWGLTELYEATFNANYLKVALELTEDLINHFWDQNNGGFYFTPDDGEGLLVRQKQSFDGAIPSGNSVAMLNLLRVGKITVNPEFEKIAEQIKNAFAAKAEQFPLAYTQFMTALDFMIGPSYEIVITGNSKTKDTMAMLKALNGCFVPNKTVVFKPTDGESPKIDEIADYMKQYNTINNKATVYVCSNYKCKTPTNDINKMMKLLSE
jgi:uncharacterized protein YyaL (SSP411 family)